MTRINSGIPVESLSGKHLLAEHREIKRICSRLRKRLESNHSFNDIPAPFFEIKDNQVKLKELFWMDKGKYTLIRYFQIYKECKKRGYNVTDFSSSWEIYNKKLDFFNDYIPTEEHIQIIKDRILYKNYLSEQKKLAKINAKS